YPCGTAGKRRLFRGSIQPGMSAGWPILPIFVAMKKFFYTLFICLVASTVVFAQNRPFWKDIQKFKAADSVEMPPKNAIVFVGSSSFTRWYDVQKDFPGHTIINRGFGGSSLPHLIEYADRIIIPYRPKQVVV